MDSASLIKKGLRVQGLPVYETDIPYIENILYTMKKAETSLQAFPHLNIEVPITVADKEKMR